MEKSEEALVEARRAKAEHLRNAGRNPFANDVDTSDRTWLGALRRKFADARTGDPTEERYDADRVTTLSGSERYHVFGRVITRRGFGKATFLVLRDATGEIQLFAKQDVMGEAFAALDDLDVADHVEARGPVMVTKKGELTLELSELRVIAKAMRPLPDKWHGLTDIDIRYRRRYVDFVASHEAAAVLRARSIVVQGLRDFLDREGFLEVETPTLHGLIGGATARPFKTHHNALDLELFLRIAPELHLKRLLVGGFERVYEIGRCYRNEGLSTRHNPEFTMLEFYQAYATYDTLMATTERLFRHVDGFLRERLDASGFAGEAKRFAENRPFTLGEPFVRVPMADAVAASIGRMNVDRNLVERLPAREGLCEILAARRHGRLGKLSQGPRRRRQRRRAAVSRLRIPRGTVPRRRLQESRRDPECSRLHRGLSRRNVAARPQERLGSERGGPLRALRARARARQRLQRAQRPRRPGGTLPSPGRAQGQRARGNHGFRRRLRARARARHAPGGRIRHGRRSLGDDAHRSAVDSRRDRVPAHETGRLDAR
jgi:lysyl-tRNA synthetase class II